MVMFKCCLCQSLLFYGGHSCVVLAWYEVALLSEIIITYQRGSKYLAGKKLSALAFCLKYDSD